jgi:hypothetical protein
VAVPPLVKTALVWGLFMGVSSNLRYQVGRRGYAAQQPQQASPAVEKQWALADGSGGTGRVLG